MTVLIDRTPQMNDGVVTGATVGAKYSSFNGTGDYVNCGDDSNLTIGTNDFSISFWASTEENDGIIISKGADTHSYIIAVGETAWIGGEDDKLNVFIGSLDITSSMVISDGIWRIFTITRSGSDLSLYVNGVSDVTVTDHADISTNVDLRIGSDGIRHFTGDIANAKIYNRALTPTEVLSLFEKEKGKFL